MATLSKMADFTISRSTGLMNAEPCGSVSATSIQTTSTQNNFLQGKPLEDLGRMAVSEGNIVYITQQQDEQATSQNEAAPSFFFLVSVLASSKEHQTKVCKSS